ncbi:Eco57I restriction-modification methylase domain-containing protein [Corallococcus sp. AS-1-12]|uniref:Eco57I restriction-modification methylase domain-containing protein n=1 Tax=Corallococcus sp. AS-1-12 TaxID=2874598 RepID=UPI001CC179E3|nr:Eco57I restriction-modification methylase domain-containing protein [Corallococcus sp. AS-1-12]MBZ4330748.1 Eco57I restriction-modification methylase domain-containing protein [Corallococcus sp. AS-1-12]
MQLQMDLPTHFGPDAYQYGKRTSGETHGVVLTKPHIVDLILDLAGYTRDRCLHELRLLDPAVGTGAFLVPAIHRLMDAANRHGIRASTLGAALTSFDIDPSHVEAARAHVREALKGHGVAMKVAARLAEQWVRVGDFLLTPLAPFDVVVGNPPYVRIEQLSQELQTEYRRRYVSLFDRADLYVAFIERSLDLLNPEGRLSFICADRWILNRYGAPLRMKLTERFRVHSYVDLHRASPFESDVIAYPSIFSISPGRSERVAVASMARATPEECESLSDQLLRALPVTHPGVFVSTYDRWFQGDEPWVLSTPEHLEALRALEARFQPIEASESTRVRIGVATGRDQVFIVPADADIEGDRMVPLVKREDIQGGVIADARRCVINTFTPEGRLVDLKRYPRLARYLKSHEQVLRRRHVAQNNTAGWYRTIDRVYPELVTRPKLLIPDIAGSNEVVFEPGHYHPHHNLYFITSEDWDLEVLGGLLSSKVALFFIWAYAVKMRGGYLRFQAQYLRRIRTPSSTELPRKLSDALRKAFRQRDFAKLDELALVAYGLKSLPAFDFVDTRR